MSGFLYFIPREQRSDAPVTPAELHAAGIGDRFPPKGNASSRGVSKSPAGPGVPGVVCADPKRVPAERIGYFPSAQTWRKIPKSDSWVGYTTDAPPTPADVARHDGGLHGHLVTLGDGNDWMIPVARSSVEHDGQLVYRNALPTTSTLDDDGRWISGDVDSRYAVLWDIACRWWDERIGIIARAEPTAADEAATITFDFAGGHEAAVAALTTNYVIGAAECALLGLLTTANVVKILDALADVPTVLKWAAEKKTSEATSSTTCGDSRTGAGGAGSIARTGRPSLTSGL